MREIRLSLNEEDFKTLVGGGVVRRESASVPIVISLQDIGCARMMSIVDAALTDWARNLPVTAEKK